MFDVTLNTNSVIIIFLLCKQKPSFFTYIQKEGMKHELYGVAKQCYKIFIIRLAKRFI